MDYLIHVLTQFFWSLDERRRQRAAARLPITHLVTVDDPEASEISPTLLSGLLANQFGLTTLPEFAAWLRREESATTHV